ncbi:hypothetical protein [Brucella anthropi]|uniref:hypothetical protein n=1 Tax=Brucella anthropi TaxID=529 RepID=UPI000DF9B023|nr:hypothetical protein [Brucella anthropi]SUB56212.1 Uncharacterised protein [Brucella anthropi]
MTQSFLVAVGFDFDRWESLRWEMHTRHGSFAVWKSDSKTWSMYGGKYGFLMLDRFSSEEEAKAEAEQIVVSLDAEPSAAPELAVSSGDIVDALFKDLRGRRFLKWLFSDRGDDCLIDVFRGGDELRGLDHEVQQEIRKAWEAIIERALHPVADKPDEAGREGEVRQQYPAAWMVRENDYEVWDFIRLKKAADDLTARGFEVIPLYTLHTPPSSEVA